MKCSIPEIAWHNRDPVLSVDFQPKVNQGDVVRLATGGADFHVIIWHVKAGEGEHSSIEVAADLARHQKAVNVVRWSPSGEFLASGDDESFIFIWKQKTDIDPPQLLEQDSDQDRETWLVYKLLRGHLEDVYDISWSPLSNFLVSGSVDNTAVIWDVHKGKTSAVLPDHKGFVQGVSWDPKNNYVVTMSSDRVFRAFDINTKKVIARSSKTKLPVPESHPLFGQTVKLFFDDTLQSYFRRLDFSPDGELVAVPSGFIECDQNGGMKPMNATYIYSRYSLKTPVCVLPCGDAPALAVRWSPLSYAPRSDGPPSLFCLQQPIRMVLAVATRLAVLLYDTQQSTPLAIVSNIHYTRLTDLTWSTDGQMLVVSSTDGFCSIIKFNPKELGEEIREKVVLTNSIESQKKGQEVPMDVQINHSDECESAQNSAISNKTPSKTELKLAEKEKKSTPKGKTTPGKKKSKGTDSPKNNKKNEKTSPTIIPIDEVAMEPWSQDGMSTKIMSPPVSVSKMPTEIIIDDPTQDMKLVYDETESDTQKETEQTIPIVEVKDSPVKSLPVNPISPMVQPKTPRRVNFITLSSPKSKKKLL